MPSFSVASTSTHLVYKMQLEELKRLRSVILSVKDTVEVFPVQFLVYIISAL